MNHKTIIWDDRAQEVEIYHVELDSHDVLVANGVPAESYRDDCNRRLFQNLSTSWMPLPQEPYAPVLTGGAVVDAVWRRLLDQAGPRKLPPLTDDPDLHLLVDGVRVDALERRDGLFVFLLGGFPSIVHIVSLATVPTELGLARDSRLLGVALRRVVVRQDTAFKIVNADDPQLTDGFHDYETTANLRWTNGYATLPSAAFARFRGEIEVVLQLAGTTQYVLSGEAAVSVAV